MYLLESVTTGQAWQLNDDAVLAVALLHIDVWLVDPQAAVDTSLNQVTRRVNLALDGALAIVLSRVWHQHYAHAALQVKSLLDGRVGKGETANAPVRIGEPD